MANEEELVAKAELIEYYDELNYEVKEAIDFWKRHTRSTEITTCFNREYNEILKSYADESETKNSLKGVFETLIEKQKELKVLEDTFCTLLDLSAEHLLREAEQSRDMLKKERKEKGVK